MRVGYLVALAAFVLLLPGVSPVPWWLDAGELTAAAVELGVPHPPGAPGFAHTGRLFAALPLGSLGFRVALASAACAAAALGLVADLLRRHRVPAPVAFVLALWPLANPTFVRAARVAEIYAYGTLLAVYVLWALAPRWGRGLAGRRALQAAFAAAVAALGFGDLRLAFFPLFALRLARAARRRDPLAGYLLVAAGAGLLAALALTLAARRAPFATWGACGDLGGLLDHLSARTIWESFADRILPDDPRAWWRAAVAFSSRLADDVGPVGLVVALVGALSLSFSARWPRARVTARQASWLGAVHTFYAVGVNPMGETDRQTGVVLAPLLAIVAGLALARFTGRLGRARWAVLPLVLAMVVLPPALRHAKEARVTGSFAAQAWALAAADQVPSGGLLLTQSDDLAAALRHAKVAADLRADLVTFPAQHLYRPPEGAAAADPRVRRLYAAARAAPDDVARARAAAAAHPGPVAFEDLGTGLFEGAPVPAAWSGRIPVIFEPPVGSAPAGPAADVKEAWKELAPLLETYEDRRRFARSSTRRLVAWIEARGGLARAPAPLLGQVAQAALFVLDRVDPAHAHAYTVLAAVFDRMGDTDRAARAARQAVALAPENPRALANLALYLGRAPPGTRGFDEAVVWARRAVRLDPASDRTWERLAWLLERAGDAAGARRARAHDLRLLDE